MLAALKRRGCFRPKPVLWQGAVSEHRLQAEALGGLQPAL